MVDSTVSAQWLRENLDRVRVLDGSWHLPASGRDAAAEFAQGHIPGAQRFDIDAIADHDTPLPHMLPSPEAFADAVAQLGIDSSSHVVVYDSLGLFSAARVWWMFRVFGHDAVSVLDGGLPAWRAAELPLETGQPAAQTGRFEARFRPELVADLDAMRALVADGQRQILDARPADRFHMRVPEPRAGIRPGRMPGAINLPMTAVLDDARKLLPPDALRRVLADAGVRPEAPSVCSCGSGVTACVLALALHRLGQHDAAVYDGSWTEWGGRGDTPIETE